MHIFEAATPTDLGILIVTLIILSGLATMAGWTAAMNHVARSKNDDDTLVIVDLDAKSPTYKTYEEQGHDLKLDAAVTLTPPGNRVMTRRSAEGIGAKRRSTEQQLNDIVG